MSGSGDKPAQTGLVDMGNIQFYDGFGSTGYTPKTVSSTETLPDFAQFTGLFSAVVLNVTWTQLQPTPGATGIVTTVIDDAIAAVVAYNAANQTDLGIKLRVWGGYTAPDWVKNINGPPITVTGQSSVDPNVFTDQTIGRYWTADYIDAWTSLQNALGTRYDSSSVIRGISQTAGAGTSDEPFVPFTTAAPKTSPTDPDTVNQVQELQRGGYNDAAEALTLRAAIADYAQWSTTPLDYTMNNHYVFDGGSEHDDPNFTLAVLQQARNSTRTVQPGNHRLQSPIYTADNFLYGQMAADAALDPGAASGSFQTASPDGLMLLTPQITDPTTYPDFPVTGSYAAWPYAIAEGVLSHAGNVEFWDYSGSEPGFPVINGFLNLTLTQAQFLSTQLAAGTAPVTAGPLDGSALGFVAPAFVTGAPGTIAFSGTNAVLLASAAAQTSYTVTLTSTHGGTLAVTDVFGSTVSGPTSGSTLTLSGSLDKVNTVLASLTDTLASGTDVVRVSATDSSGDSAVRNVGVQIAAPATSLTPSPGAGPSAFQSDGILAVGGVRSSFVVAGGLQIGSGGSATTLLAALAPNAYSTASLTIGGTFEVRSGGAAWFTGSLGAPTVTVDAGGAIHGDGTVTASGGGPITNNGTVEAVADLTLGLQRLTVASALTGSGTGKLIIDPGATLVLGGTVASQTIAFAPNSNAQFANGPYSPSTLELAAPLAVSAPISGFTFADRLILDGLSLTTADVTYDSVALKLHVNVSGTNHDFDLAGDLTGLDPIVTSGNIIQFVAPAAGIAPSVTAPLALEGANGVPVLVPGIVLNTPLPATAPSDLTVQVTLTAAGKLSAGNNHGLTTVTGNDSTTLTLSGLLADVERSLQTLTYKAPAAAPDTITINVTDYAGPNAAPATITVSNNAAPQQFDWASAAGGSLADNTRWQKPGGGAESTAPGYTNIAAFGTGAYTVSDDAAVGEIVVTGAPTLTGHVSVQGLSSRALDVDSGGVLTLAGGAVLSAGQQAIVGDTGEGLLALMGGALDLTGPAASNALVLGAQGGSNGTVLNLELITAAGTVVVGQAGTGVLELRGVASSVSDGGADIGQSAGSNGTATVNGGEWTNSGQLIVGDAGTGTLLINGMNNGIAGQVTAFNATIGNQAGGQGSVTLDGGEFLVANDMVPTSTLSVGGAGNGILAITNGSEVAVGAALGKPSNNSTTVFPNTGVLAVGATAGGNGQVSISGNSALLVYGNATVGGPGVGRVTVGANEDDIALFALLGTLTVNDAGQVGLGGASATLRASTFDIASGGLISGAGTLSGDGAGNQTILPATIDNNGTRPAATCWSTATSPVPAFSPSPPARP